MTCIAVVDLGKSNSKVALVDTDTASELQVFTTPAPIVESGLYPHIDHQHIEAFIIDSLAQLASSNQVDALTVTTHGATGALIDPAGNLVLPVMDYEFKDIDQSREAYEQIRPPFSETGSPALPGGLNLGAQLYWQQQKFSEPFKAVSTILTWPQYWVHWLCGARINDVTSLGCHTDLYAPKLGAASSIFSRTDWGDRMPPVRDSGQFAAPINNIIAARTALPSQLPVHVGIHDSNASLVPYLTESRKSFSVLSTGTWIIAMAVGGKEVILDEHRDSLLNVNASGAVVPSARFMGGRERHELSEQCCADALSANVIDRALIQLTKKEVFVMPSHVKGTGPYPRATGRWIGNSAALADAERLCAIALYLALMSDECLTLIGARGTTFVEGPMAHDVAFAQMLAAATGRAVSLSESMTGTSVGAAMLIARPVHELSNTLVDTPADRERLLCGYAIQWRERLRRHTQATDQADRNQV